jgi:hypothetical protein
MLKPFPQTPAKKWSSPYPIKATKWLNINNRGWSPRSMQTRDFTTLKGLNPFQGSERLDLSISSGFTGGYWDLGLSGHKSISSNGTVKPCLLDFAPELLYEISLKNLNPFPKPLPQNKFPQNQKDKQFL